MSKIAPIPGGPAAPVTVAGAGASAPASPPASPASCASCAPPPAARRRPRPKGARPGAATRYGPPCVLVFNASDPSGAGGLSADISTIAAIGGHPLAVVTGAYARDTTAIFDHFCLPDTAVQEQARAVLEDLPVRAIKVGFAGSVENIAAIAAICADYENLPVVAWLPDLSWWEEGQIDEYLDAARELLLPQTSLLVGNHSALWRWLLPDWRGPGSPGAQDIARAAARLTVPYTLVTGIALPEQFVQNVLASHQAQLYSRRYELFDASFCGAGDTLSAAAAVLLSAGSDLGLTATEALNYLDRCLAAAFRPGMGHALPDRMYWARRGDDGDEDEDKNAGAPAPAQTQTTDRTTTEDQAPQGFVMPPHATKH